MLLFLIVPPVLGGIAAVGAKIGEAIAGIGLLWVPILFLTGAAVVVLTVGAAQERRKAALEAEEQRRRAAAILERRRTIAERKKAEAQERETRLKQAEEAQRRAIARQKVERRRQEAERRRRVEELGESAVKLIERAESASERVVRTEAASMGWLGDPGELDFSPDITMITANVEASAHLRRLANELKALPEQTDADRERLDAAKRSAEKLWRRANTRVKLLEECAAQARRIDESLKQERERARIAQQREEIASRLDAALYGAAAPADGPSSDNADEVTALVAAYKELKQSLELDRKRPSDDEDSTDTPAGNSSSWGVLAPVNRAWHWAFG